MANRMSRREFLNYVWGASIALVLAQTTGITVWFALPRQQKNSAWIEIQEMPARNQAPQMGHTVNATFFKVHTDEGIAFFDIHCTHYHCNMAWQEAPRPLFYCPCHGSQFLPNGAYIAGPAPRSPDRFAFEIWDDQNQLLVRSTEGLAVPLPTHAAKLWVDTSQVIRGQARPS